MVVVRVAAGACATTAGGCVTTTGGAVVVVAVVVAAADVLVGTLRTGADASETGSDGVEQPASAARASRAATAPILPGSVRVTSDVSVVRFGPQRSRARDRQEW
ncbi:hypothetical protein GCM10009836_70740 [Pseudonocardia ailaonensis]|uniref:Secreted protein n=1 Tax=Pseudonocardia ailaonensis TaxID=367279 RepID=A0ABN2NP12_9PSEU